ncbi:MAG: hypothetical protein JST64_05600, partial [Actinobacteria bacterium]|nr:hypothetical protein [Actinomycetota bacterium]
MSTTETTDTADIADTTSRSDGADEVMTITDQAMATVLEIRGQEDDPEQLALRVEIIGSRGAEYTYDLSFEELSAAASDDHLYRLGVLEVMVPAATVDRLRGAELDLPTNSAQGGLVIRNPNRPDPLAGLDIELSGDVSEKVTQLLEQAVNPALASHGGYANLVDVDEENN